MIFIIRFIGIKFNILIQIYIYTHTRTRTHTPRDTRMPTIIRPAYT